MIEGIATVTLNLLAPGARLRARVVPEPPAGRRSDEAPTESAPTGGDAPARAADPATPRPCRERRPYPWAELMQRVFAVDVLECPRCQGPMRILAAIHPPDTAGAILECLGLPARPPPQAPARRAAAPLFESDPDW